MKAQQLKNSILQMAIQGKLVPQDPNDEPASVLLERIRKEKEQMIKEGKIKKEKNPSVIFKGSDNLYYENVGKETECIQDKLPFEIPENWAWIRINSLGSIIRGNGIKRTEVVKNGKPCVRYGELYTTYNISFEQTLSFISDELYKKCKYVSNGDILMTLTGENKPDIAKSVAYLGTEQIAAGGDLAFWTRHGMNPLYLVYFMASPYAINQKIELSTGDIIVHISGEKIGSILVPIPPLDEQERIVNKVFELNSMVELYDIKETELSKLNDSFPELLKKSILQQAIQGKLVPQAPNDEPASVLLERIRKEKQQLIMEGKIKKDKNESFIYRRDNSHYEKLNGIERCIDNEIPFDIPDSWCWTRLGVVSTYSQTKQKINAQLADSDWWGLDLEDIEKGGNILSKRKVSERKSTGEKTKFYSGDILYSKLRPYLKKVLVAPMDGICTSEIVPFKMFGNINSEYVVYYLKSPYIDTIVNSVSYGVKMPRVGTDTMISLLIPVPPIEEQRRIVDMLNRVNINTQLY